MRKKNATVQEVIEAAEVAEVAEVASEKVADIETELQKDTEAKLAVANLKFSEAVKRMAEAKTSFDKLQRGIGLVWPQTIGGRGRGRSSIVSLLDNGASVDEVVAYYRKLEQPKSAAELKAELERIQAQLKFAEENKSQFE